MFNPVQHEEEKRKEQDRRRMARKKKEAQNAAQQKAIYELHVATVVRVGEAAGVATGIISPPDGRDEIMPPIATGAESSLRVMDSDSGDDFMPFTDSCNDAPTDSVPTQQQQQQQPEQQHQQLSLHSAQFNIEDDEICSIWSL